ncbi:hypothetical protein PAA8504_01843 [Palleronia abyssalis]|uniref:Uncharacterized protein n=2 Tax=Palleronia abyssalis TaxID=1501240 RepID=A0A2R8BV36_9RHOB|nr:hypothetical protein PAA8504_01843 [Palleronia abyssalis]
MQEDHEMTDPIRTRADGSIDTAYYMRRGRIARGEAAYDMARRAVPSRRTPTGARRPWMMPLVIVAFAGLTVPYLL